MDETLSIAINVSEMRARFLQNQGNDAKRLTNGRGYIIGYPMQRRPRCTFYGLVNTEYVRKKRCLANCPLLPVTCYLVNVAAARGEKMVQGHPIAHLALTLHAACSANWVSRRTDCHSSLSGRISISFPPRAFFWFLRRGDDLILWWKIVHATILLAPVTHSMTRNTYTPRRLLKIEKSNCGESPSLRACDKNRSIAHS